MSQLNKLYRNFIILQEDERGYSNSGDKTLSGYSKIEAKGETCKISFYAQNLRGGEEDYHMIAICSKKDTRKIIDLGKVNIIEGAKFEVTKEYPVDSIGGLGIPYDKICGAGIAKMKDNIPITIMYGFINGEKPSEDWKNYKMVKAAYEKPMILSKAKKEEKKYDKKDKKGKKDKDYDDCMLEDKKDKKEHDKKEYDKKYKDHDDCMLEEKKDKKEHDKKEHDKKDKDHDDCILEDEKDKKEHYEKEKIEIKVKVEAIEDMDIEVCEDEKHKHEHKEKDKKDKEDDCKEDEKHEEKHKHEEKDKHDEHHHKHHHNHDDDCDECDECYDCRDDQTRSNDDIGEIIDEDVRNEDNPFNEENINKNPFVSRRYYENTDLNRRDEKNKYDEYEEKIEKFSDVFKIKGSVGEYFEGIANGLEHCKDRYKEIKYCKWYKLPVYDLHEMCNMSNYNRYTVAYYPMLNYYPYIRKHKHFMLGYKCDKDGNLKYIIYGVPGKKDKDEQPYEGKTGFVTWVSENDGSDMGCWLMFYDFKNSTVVVPMK